MAVTLKDISRMTGVSVGLVSKVLNDKPCRISSEKRASIIKCAEDHNYKRNILASSLVTRKTYTIGLLIPDITNIFFSSLAKTIDTFFKNHDYTILISNSDDTMSNDIDIINNFSSRQVDGLLVVLSNESCQKENEEELLKVLNRISVPFVLLDRVVDNTDFSSVSSDNEAGAYMATQYLLNHNHQSIACIGVSSSLNGRARLKGFQRAVEEAKAIDVTYYEGDFHFKSGYKIGKDLDVSKITGVFSMNDMMSFGLAKALNERGLKIGKDLSLVSYDNLDLIQALGIELSSVDQDVNHLGRLSSELLLDMMKENCDRKTIVLQPKLIKRDSVKKF